MIAQSSSGGSRRDLIMVARWAYKRNALRDVVMYAAVGKSLSLYHSRGFFFLFMRHSSRKNRALTLQKLSVLEESKKRVHHILFPCLFPRRHIVELAYRYAARNLHERWDAIWESYIFAKIINASQTRQSSIMCIINPKLELYYILKM